MCGICGNFGPGERRTVEGMLGTIVHRGPDDGHYVYEESFALGARRLSILDVEGGQQPLCDAAGQVWAAQNGEIYNFPELRRRLEASGTMFKTRCDTELLPYLYLQFGMDFPRHLDGMFAVAIWDKARSRGVLARDRMGKKPLYYTVVNGTLYFSSEIKALLSVPGFERQINEEALDCYLSYKHVPSPLSIFKNVYSLPPAHTLIYTSAGDIKIQRYWDLDFSADQSDRKLSEVEIVDEIERLLKKGVEKRLLSDVPIGFFLSGGIDSSLSTAIAAELTGSRLKTFTLTYDADSTTSGKEADRNWASWVAAKYDTEHHEEMVEYANFPDKVQDLISCFDEPFCGTMSTYFLSGAIAKHVKVAVSGDGADELFGSYLSHRLAIPIANYSEYLKTGDSNLLRPFENEPEIIAQYSQSQFWPGDLFVFSAEEKQKLYSDKLDSSAAHRRHQENFSKLTANDPLNRILEGEYRTFFTDQVLTFVDRLSMAHSLEVRSAFLDKELVEFVSRLPGSSKVRNGETKYLLKQVAKRYFPDEMVNRPKEGFIMPVTNWILDDLEEYVRDTLSPSRLASHGIFEQSYVVSLIENLYSPGSRKHYREVNKILSLIIFQEWYDLYLGKGRQAEAARATAERITPSLVVKK